MGTQTPGVIRVAVSALIAALLALGALLTIAVPEAQAATFALRLEAGPQPAVSFSSSWAIVGRRTVTLASPLNVTGSVRKVVPARGVYLRVASGPLAGWWVAEGRTAYRPGIVTAVVYSPTQEIRLAAARYELYRFDPTGALTSAKGLAATAGMTLRTDRAAVVNGLRHLHVASGTWAGWWLPGSVTAPERITCTAGSPPTGTAGRLVRSVSNATGEIALTFDMGGRLTPAMSIVRYLELERVCATIFPTAAAASTTVGRQVMAEIRAHPELFEVGNHTQHHCNLRDGGGGAACPALRPSSAFATAELRTAEVTIAGLTGRHTTPFWRPPYGAVDATLVGIAARAGWPYTILWSTDTIDWRPPADGGPTAASVAAKVITSRRAGGIVLMHLGGYPTRNALPAMLTGLRAAGYTATTLSALYR